MMWHWMISGLSVGATVVLYDGSPFYPSNTALLDLIDELGISIFGCGAKIIETYLKNSIKPYKSHQLKKLKTILTTGSPLLKESFEYLYRDVKKNIRVSSISGGSDILSCFALGNPLLPVYAEELQCRGLGMAVKIFDDVGNTIINKPGELVCTKPFPTMPLYFWNDLDGEKYFHAYFDQYENVWTHGDYAKITEHGGLIIYGRSDATLNPGGIRIGTADIYEQVLKIPAVVDCVAAGLQKNNDEEIILFVKLKNNVLLDEKLISEIKKLVRDNTTPFHVPKKIIQVSGIPKTMNGKTMEMAVKNIINGREIKNSEAVANPAIQMCSSHLVDDNLKMAAHFIAEAAHNKTQLVVLPEMFAIMGKNPADKIAVKEIYGAGKIQDFLSAQAKMHHIWIVGGTIPIACDNKNKVRAASIVYDNHGKSVARYDKIHLFDVTLSETESYRESDTTEPGSDIVVVDTPFGKLGLSVCYRTTKSRR